MTVPIECGEGFVHDAWDAPYYRSTRNKLIHRKTTCDDAKRAPALRGLSHHLPIPVVLPI